MPENNQIAYLGMYDFPALQAAQDGWWKGLVGHFRKRGFSHLPPSLNRSGADPYTIWQDPNLFFAQTCGYPLTHRLAGKVQLVGTPCYDAPGCQGALYRSLFVVRADAAAESLDAALPCRLALNAKDSYSGWRVWGAEHGDSFSQLVISGSHAKSIDLVRQGKADMAAIDCVTHALIGDVQPQRLVGTRVIGQSAPAPGLPFITSATMDAQQVKDIAEALTDAFDDPGLAAARRTLRLADFKIVPLSAYVDKMINNE